MDKTDINAKKSIADDMLYRTIFERERVAGVEDEKPRAKVHARTAALDPDLPGVQAFSAIRAGNVLQLRQYIDEGGQIGDLLVATASAAGALDMVKMLLERGLPKNMTTTSVHCALKNGHDAIADYLLDHGAPADIDPILSLLDKPDAVRFLLQKKFPPKPEALVKALCEKHYEVIQMLLDAGVSTCERSVQNALKRGIFDGDVRMLEMVLKHGVVLDSTCLNSLRRQQSPALRLLWESLPPDQRSSKTSTRNTTGVRRFEAVVDGGNFSPLHEPIALDGGLQ